jgi:3-oxoacyl-[acyl-carrier-protein] synthase-3
MVGVSVQRALGLREIPCIDIRQQCTGFIYALSIADAYIRIGTFKHILVIGSEVHSTGLDVSTAGRDVTVLFGPAPAPWSSAARPTSRT